MGKLGVFKKEVGGWSGDPRVVKPGVAEPGISFQVHHEIEHFKLLDISPHLLQGRGNSLVSARKGSFSIQTT